MATPVLTLKIKPQKALLDYQDGHTFKKKFKAKPYVSGKQDKYDAICEKYKSFAALYKRLTGRNQKMVADGFTLLQEVDYLFNFLYHDHPKTPSHGQKQPRTLSDMQREKAIKTYFKEMCDYCRNLGIYATPNFYVEENGKRYDMSFLIDANGEIIGRQKMVHVAQCENFYEQDYYTPS